MKLQNLFENYVSEDECLNYVYSDVLLRYSFYGLKDKFKEFISQNPLTKLKAIKFLKELEQGPDAKVHHEFFEDNRYLRFIKVTANGVDSATVYLHNFDELGDPPFKFNSVKGSFVVARNCDNLTQIPEWFPNQCTLLSVLGSNIQSLEGIHKIVRKCKRIEFMEAPIKSNILGLLLIDELKAVTISLPQSMIDAHPIDGFYVKLEDIINRHLSGDRDVFECQEELIDAGYKEYAQL